MNLINIFVRMNLFFFNPIKKTLDKRKELIEGQFKAAEDKEKKADELQAEYQSQLSGVEDEKKQILAEARNNAKAEYDKIVARANTQMQQKSRQMPKKHQNLKAKRHALQLSSKSQSLQCKQLQKLLKRKFQLKLIKCSMMNF